MGIGLNVNTKLEELGCIERPVWPATSLCVATGRDVVEFEVANLRKKIAFVFATNLQKFFADGFAAFRDRVNGLDVYIGQTVQLKVSEKSTATGEYMGINDSGHIVMKLTEGEDRGKTQAFPSGEVISVEKPTGTSNREGRGRRTPPCASGRDEIPAYE